MKLVHCFQKECCHIRVITNDMKRDIVSRVFPVALRLLISLHGSHDLPAIDESPSKTLFRTASVADAYTLCIS